MSLTQAEVEHIAKLARLELTQEELARYREQLSAILDYAARLRELDTSQIPPTTSVLLCQPAAARRRTRQKPGRFGRAEQRAAG